MTKETNFSHVQMKIKNALAHTLSITRAKNSYLSQFLIISPQNLLLHLLQPQAIHLQWNHPIVLQQLC